MININTDDRKPFDPKNDQGFAVDSQDCVWYFGSLPFIAVYFYNDAIIHSTLSMQEIIDEVGPFTWFNGSITMRN